MTTHPQLMSVLKFKQISAQLNDTELDAFMSKMWRTVGKEHTVQLLCAPSMNQSNSNLDTLTSMTLLASDIIQNRDSTDPACAIGNITDLPTSLIGEIASYLYQEDYCAFSSVSRKLYVDCNSPNRLQEMGLTFVVNHADVAIERFPQLKSLEFNLKQIIEFKVINGQRFGACSQLQELIIDGQPINDDNVTISDLDMLINDSSPCLSAIRSLTFRGFEGDTAIPMDRLVAALDRFKNATRLALISIDLRGTLDSVQLSALCPNITELNTLISSPRMAGPLLTSWC